MTPGVRKSVLVIGALVALFGVLMALQVVRVGVIGPTCDQFVLARAVSPNGSLAAEHVREDCGAKGIIHSLYVGPAHPGGDATYSGYQLFEGDSRAESDAHIQASVLWWDGDDRLNVIYPRGTDFLKQTELSGVRVRAAGRSELE